MRFLIPLLIAPTFVSADPCELAREAALGWLQSVKEMNGHATAMHANSSILELENPAAHLAARSVIRQADMISDDAQSGIDKVLEVSKQIAAECKF